MNNSEDREILRQHQTMLDVMFEFQRSRWPWVRWVAHQFQDEVMRRVANRIPPRLWVEEKQR